MPGLTAERYAWVKDAAAKYLNGNEAALIAVIQHESGWGADAQNPKSSAAGLGQFITSTARSSSYPMFNGGAAAGIQWTKGTLYDKPYGHPDDARYDAKRSIYAAAKLLGWSMESQHGDVGLAYIEHYHGYCKKNTTTCANQKKEAINGAKDVVAIYDKIRNNGCKATGTTSPSTPVSGPVTPGSGPCCGLQKINEQYIYYRSSLSTGYLMPQAADALYKASKAYFEKTGKKLPLTNIYRSYKQQKEMWDACHYSNGKSKPCPYKSPAAPGSSPHQAGLAVDVNMKGAICSGCDPSKCPLYQTLIQVMHDNGWEPQDKRLCQTESHHFNYRPCLSKYGSSSAAIPAASGQKCKK